MSNEEVNCFSNKTRAVMIKNYVKVAIRNLIRNKTYVLINTLGMGIAIACCMTGVSAHCLQRRV